ncbi:SDR family oxidoreductase [Variovorax sp. Sphag1AA]|uniref:SDR family NAD(P)-dependent oxidoreductase n=1 Tax=Variovorax sp. Sphag1AA TaxID=2587027 RepID=UPI001617F1E3|nr:SDR family oxidoreductase [Variovorax sp. Sphag1AA]MBB3178277.1 NAD(P)-dependent dehydrogenase (short-subunit alcohol dehydrogenase family) [Variovorax sp. Sphag1AA]
MQTVLITGAASGIGRDAARLFAAAGWQCVLVDHNEAALHALGRTLPSPASCAHVLRTIDLTDAAQVASLRDGTPALDAILNNAGMSDASNTPLVEQSPAQMARLLALNLAAPAAVIDACTPLIKPGARIVNVSSGAGLNAIPWRGAYSPSKAGLIAQTRALAAARPDWCVTVLAPGFVRTELVDGLIQAGRIKPENAVGKIPLGRMALPAEMAQALFFLATPGAAPLHGQVLAFNGGSSVFGGSQRFEPATLEPLPLDLPVRLEVVGGDGAAWQALATKPATGPHYDACLDLSPLSCKGPGLLQAVHAAAVRFHTRNAQQASLTLLLPRTRNTRWQDAGDAAAARMLVSTLACEWGGRALRINALEVPEGLDPDSLHPLLRFVCGPAAQYLTGQTLVCGSTALGDTR